MRYSEQLNLRLRADTYGNLTVFCKKLFGKKMKLSETVRLFLEECLNDDNLKARLLAKQRLPGK